MSDVRSRCRAPMGECCGGCDFRTPEEKAEDEFFEAEQERIAAARDIAFAWAEEGRTDNWLLSQPEAAAS